MSNLELILSKCDQANKDKIKIIKNEDILAKIADTIKLCDPDNLFIQTGTEEDKEYVKKMTLETGEEEKLKMKGHTIHFDPPYEQGRIVDQTYAIEDKGVYTSSLANAMPREEADALIENKMRNIMKGKTMIVGFYIRGPVGAPTAFASLTLSDTWYLVHQQDNLYKCNSVNFEKQVELIGFFYTNTHSKGTLNTKDAYVLTDRKKQETWAWNVSYLGNCALIKKGHHRLSNDDAIYKNRGLRLSEHMFITGIKMKDGSYSWIDGAAPSGCGKTTTAMAGDSFVGDDLAQVWIAEDGTIRSINPEFGIFGIVRDVNFEGDPVLMDRLRNPGSEVIWSNVLVSDGIPYWEGNNEEIPESGKNFQGEWIKGKKDADGKLIPISHPNARATIRANQLSNYNEKSADNPNGVETKVFTYSGRDADTMPPVVAALNSEEGVTFGADITSATTATEVGAKGEVKRSPWANAPFFLGALGDYMDGQFQFFTNPKLKERPVLASLNYFLTEEARGGSTKKLLGEKRDVKVWLTWLARLANKELKGMKTALGIIPTFEELDSLFKELIPNKNYTKELYDKQFSLYIDKIIKIIDMQIEAYKKEVNIPDIYFETQDNKKARLEELKSLKGSIVKPDDLK
ncbi:MAG: phosphoenolpyruvate carboxykinase domain-containing protein [Candidatus Marinimicrobia bacterium]|nr:phosphoenolpyruvate carboxykinase domain-containing protein [Candidatus Neomarinimicrobiota bacterium]